MSHEVRLDFRDGRTALVVAEGGESILEAAEGADVALPFGCRRGACATCTGRLRSGTVEHRRPPRALKARQIDAGYVLTCVAEPRGDCRISVGADVAAELVTNPWQG